MWFARLICSDDDCDYAVELFTDDVREIETLSCDCGAGMAIVGFVDHIEEGDGAVVTAFPVLVDVPLAA